MKRLPGLARSPLAAGCRMGGLLARAERGLAGTITILCYHRVGPPELRGSYFEPSLVVTPQCFARHCDVLRRHYDVRTLRAALDPRGQRAATAQRPVVVMTFDDGYVDNHHHALPILSRFGLSATFFILADLVGRREAPWYDRLARAVAAFDGHGVLSGVDDAIGSAGSSAAPDAGRNGWTPKRVVQWAKRLPARDRAAVVQRLTTEADSDRSFSDDDFIMDQGMLAELAAAGHEVGSHGARHELLPDLNDDELEAEVAGSRRTLERYVGGPVESFCYPNGDYDERVVRAVQAAGYRRAVTVQPGLNKSDADRFRLRRRHIDETRLAGPLGGPSATLLRLEVCGLADRVFLRSKRRGLSS